MLTRTAFLAHPRAALLRKHCFSLVDAAKEVLSSSLPCLPVEQHIDLVCQALLTAQVQPDQHGELFVSEQVPHDPLLVAEYLAGQALLVCISPLPARQRVQRALEEWSLLHHGPLFVLRDDAVPPVVQRRILLPLWMEMAEDLLMRTSEDPRYIFA